MSDQICKKQMAAFTPAIAKHFEIKTYFYLVVLAIFTFTKFSALYFAVTAAAGFIILVFYFMPLYKQFNMNGVPKSEINKIMLAFGLFIISIMLLFYISAGKIFDIRNPTLPIIAFFCIITAPSLNILYIHALTKRSASTLR